MLKKISILFLFKSPKLCNFAPNYNKKGITEYAIKTTR